VLIENPFADRNGRSWNRTCAPLSPGQCRLNVYRSRQGMEVLAVCCGMGGSALPGRNGSGHVAQLVWLMLRGGGKVNWRPTEAGDDSAFHKMGVLERPAILAGEIVNFLASLIHERNVEEPPCRCPAASKGVSSFSRYRVHTCPPKTCQCKRDSVVNSLSEI
jgi:hypothetical protein